MLKLKIGKKYITRRGFIATILHIDMSEKCPARGRIHYGDNRYVYVRWTLDGRYSVNHPDDDLDIVAEEKKEVKKKKTLNLI